MLDFPTFMIQTVYVCDKCNNHIFTLGKDLADQKRCPFEFCPGTAWAVEDINVIIKNPKGSKQPNYYREERKI